MNRIIWAIHRLRKKLCRLFRGIAIGILYATPYYVKTYGKVCFDCQNIHFGKNVSIGANVRIFGSGEVILDDNVEIGDGCIICASNRIYIGRDTMFAGQCYIIDCNHGMKLGQKISRQPISKGTVYIGENVWIGCGCAVLKNAIIDDGAVIGAGTVVSNETGKDRILYQERKYISTMRH